MNVVQNRARPRSSSVVIIIDATEDEGGGINPISRQSSAFAREDGARSQSLSRRRRRRPSRKVMGLGERSAVSVFPRALCASPSTVTRERNE